jgi:glycosyltransferase involved in cell wall biosynthesis
VIKGILYASLGPPNGYGVAAKAYMLAFRDAGIPVSWVPMVRGGSWGLGYEPGFGTATDDADLGSLCNAPVEYDTVIVHTVPEWFPPWAALERGRRVIGCTVWETDRLRDDWPALLGAVDRVVVPTRWNRDTIVDSGAEVPVDVVPYVARDFGPSGGLRLPGVTPEDFVFYSIGVWTSRKALDLTVEAFLRAFDADDEAVLVLKTGATDLARGALGLLVVPTRRRVRGLQRRLRSGARVVVHGGDVGEAEIAALHERGDCYVSLTRAEGWGLGAFEAAAAGNPVIITGFGGQREFLPVELAYFVDYELCPARALGVERRVYRGEHRWAEPSVEHGVALMRHVFEHRQEARRRGKALQEHVRREFAAERVVQQFMRSIEKTPVP